MNRSKSVRQRLFEKRSSTISEKPLPRDPLSLKPRTPTTSKHFDSPPTTAKDQPDTPARRPNTSEGVRKRILNRAKSCSALIAEAGAGAEKPPPIPSTPSTPGKLKRKLSKPFLLKRSASEKLDLSKDRPRTAPQPLRPSRSVSIEQLRAFCTTPRPRTRQSMVKSPTQARQEAHDQLTNGRETMKNQISQFLKTDRVVEAWDSVSKNASCCVRPLAKTKEKWPSSIFRTKSSTTLQNNQGDTLSGPDLERQMSWVQETSDVLPTHSFKAKPETSPRIHVLSVQMTLDAEANVAEREASLDLRSESSITALPAVPAPPIPPV
jgi:hypothetical protein